MPDTLAGQLTHRLLQRLRRVRVGTTHPAAGSVPGTAGQAVMPAARVPAATLLPTCTTTAGEVPAQAAPVPAVGSVAARRASPLRVPGARCRVDPADGQRTLISGRMNEVCDALDRLIAHQTLPAAPISFAPTRV